mgnify:FL=1
MSDDLISRAAAMSVVLAYATPERAEAAAATLAALPALPTTTGER